MRTIKERRAEAANAGGRDPNGAKYIRFLPLLLFAIAGLVFIPQLCAKQRDQQLREHGEPAVAEILSIRETGNLYNRKPEVELELDVTPAKGERFRVEVTKVLAQTELAQYTVGARVEVRYDPAAPDTVALIGLAKDAPE